jgi:hypothetical protein
LEYKHPISLAKDLGRLLVVTVYIEGQLTPSNRSQTETLHHNIPVPNVCHPDEKLERVEVALFSDAALDIPLDPSFTLSPVGRKS